ncbi:MAG: extracellular solute-binding protein [Chloroflexi bacterium]|nr:extracellular solute-binding protein [Chloroflexota bacterium]
MDTGDSTRERSRLSRRAVLSRGAFGLTGLLLMACGQSATPSSAPAATSAPAKPAGQAAAPAAPAAATSAPPAAAAAAPTAAAATAPKPAAGDAPVKLTFWRHQYDPTDKAYREIIFPAVREKLNVEVDYQVQRDDDYKTKMLPQLASGTGPDIFEATEAFRLKFGKAGVYAPVDVGAWGGKEKWDAFWEKGVTDALKIDGKEFNVPLEWSAIPVNLFVNGQHADEAGVGADIAKYQQTPITWADLGPFAAKMTKKDAGGQITRDGFMIQHGYGPDRSYAFWEPMFLQSGGKLVSDDGKTSLLNSEQGVAAMQNLVDYIAKGASMLRPQDKESGSAKLAKEETSSTTAMSQWAYGTFKQLNPDTWQNIKSLLAPQINPSKPLYFSGPGWTAGVFAKSPQVATSFKLLQFIAANHGNDLFEGGIVTPVAGWTEKYPGLQKLPDAAVWTKLSKEAVPRVNSEAELLTGVQRSEGYQRAFETIMFNKGDIKAELDKWNKDVQEALSGL